LSCKKNKKRAPLDDKASAMLARFSCRNRKIMKRQEFRHAFCKQSIDEKSGAFCSVFLCFVWMLENGAVTVKNRRAYRLECHDAIHLDNEGFGTS
jgi:hypothetical protein